MDQVDAEDAERLGLRAVFRVEHAHVQDDVVGSLARPQLQANADPAVTLVFLVVGACGDRGGVGEVGGVRRTHIGEALHQQVELVAEHLFQPLAADVAAHLAVDRITDAHVVGRGGLGDGAGGSAGAEELPRDLLAGTDFHHRAVLQFVEIDGERLLLGAQVGIAFVQHGSAGC